MRGNLTRTINILEGFINPAQSDIASDTDNNWTDTPVVDAHVYLGWTYDYFFKRFGRRGLDNNDRPIRAIVHPVSRSDIFQHINDDEIFGTFYLNAFWCGECGGGTMMFGEGLPPNFTVDVGYFSAALDVVGHELTHGVTEYSSNLIYQGESGALNEAFSDIMGASVEFFFQPTRADWLMAEDLAIVEAGLARSLEDPRRLRRSRSLQHPLHRSRGQRRRPHQLDDREPRVLSRGPGRHEPHVRPLGAGRRLRQSRADREGVLSRVRVPDAAERDVRGRASGDAAGGHRSLWRQQPGVPRRQPGVGCGRCSVNPHTRRR